MTARAGVVTFSVRSRGCVSAAVIVLAAFALSGCVESPDTSPPAVPSSSSTAGPVVSTPDEETPHDDATVAPVPEAGTGSSAAAVAAAEKVMTVFGQPDLDPDTWIRNLYPLLSQAGAAAYEGTDPATVPVHQVTGPGTLLDGSTEVALVIQVPTDAGPYTVALSRTSTTSPWLADRIRPAER
jgi:hypothetical protein